MRRCTETHHVSRCTAASARMMLAMIASFDKERRVQRCRLCTQEYNSHVTDAGPRGFLSSAVGACRVGEQIARRLAGCTILTDIRSRGGNLIVTNAVPKRSWRDFMTWQSSTVAKWRTVPRFLFIQTVSASATMCSRSQEAADSPTSNVKKVSSAG